MVQENCRYGSVDADMPRPALTRAYLDTGIKDYHKNKLPLLSQHQHEELSVFADLPKPGAGTAADVRFRNLSTVASTTYPMDIFSNGYMILLKSWVSPMI